MLVRRAGEVFSGALIHGVVADPAGPRAESVLWGSRRRMHTQLALVATQQPFVVAVQLGTLTPDQPVDPG
jgi:hypothetical protein